VLSALGLSAPLSLPRIAGASLRAALGTGPIVTDDRPRIEHFAAGLPREGGSTDGMGAAFMHEMFGEQRANQPNQ
jgi:hypothetical protein